MSSKNTLSITINKETKEKLDECKKYPGDTYSNIITRLLKAAKLMRIKVD